MSIEEAWKQISNCVQIEIKQSWTQYGNRENIKKDWIDKNDWKGTERA